MRRLKSSFGTIEFHVIVGAAVGIFLLHPVTMAIYWFEFHHEHPTFVSMWQFFLYRIDRAFTGEMLLMTLIFAVIGGLLGCGSGVYDWAIARRDQLLNYLHRELALDVQSLISGGEGEAVEFKSSA